MMWTKPTPARSCTLLVIFIAAAQLSFAAQKKQKKETEPIQSAENTIRVEPRPVKPQTFSRPVRLYVEKVVDRSGNPRPLLIGNGVFVDREPTAIIRASLEDSLRSGDALAESADSADYLVSVYLFDFSVWKIELNTVVKERVSGKSQTVQALGTSIPNGALRKKTLMRNIDSSLEDTIQDALRNLLRGSRLREAIEALPGPAGQ